MLAGGSPRALDEDADRLATDEGNAPRKGQRDREREAVRARERESEEARRPAKGSEKRRKG